MGRVHVRRRRGDRGASAVEFALLVLPLTLIVFGIIAFGIMLSFRQTMSQAATEGARAAAVQPATVSDGDRHDAALAAVEDAMAAVIFGDDNMECGSGGLTCTPVKVTCGTETCYEVTVSYPYQDNGPVQIPLVNELMPETLEYTAVVRVS